VFLYVPAPVLATTVLPLYAYTVPDDRALAEERTFDPRGETELVALQLEKMIFAPVRLMFVYAQK